MLRSVRLALVAVAVSGAIGASVGVSASSSVTIEPDEVDGAAVATQSAIRSPERTSVEPDPGPQAGSLDPLLQSVLDLTNAERARVGLAPLQHNALLTQAAQLHSEDQARRDTLTHYGPNGESPGDRIAATGYRFRTWAENAAMGYRTAESVMDGWMNSPGHRDNVLRASVTEIGLGLAYTPSGVPYWTQVFAAPR
ncbi:MAG: CAP domain-containing protein [Actinomycetota bacterium]